jgi:hypothetical protein
VERTGWYRGRKAVLLSHGAGGFGFISDLLWLPELKVGIAVLTNSSEHKLQGSLALDILNDLVHEPGLYHDRLMALPNIGPVTQGNDYWQPPATLASDIAARALPLDSAGWPSYLGEYKAANWGMINPLSPPNRVYEQQGALYFDGTDMEDPARLHLYDAAPGLFFTETGEALDFRSTPPTYRSIKLTRIGPGPSPAAWGVLAGSGLVMFFWLLVLPARPIWGWLRPKPASVDSAAKVAASGGAWARTASILGAAGSLLGLASIGLVAAMPRLIYAGYLGWLNVPVWQKLLFDGPLGLALCAVGLCALAVPCSGYTLHPAEFET